MVVASQSVQELCINSIRFLAVDAIEKAKSGHPANGCSPHGVCAVGSVHAL
jgi:transketolase